jgi:adenosylcobinamide amidohydrolase
MLVWRFDRPLLAISSGPFGGGIGVRHWAINATVVREYSRNDPDAHLAELAAVAGLDGAGLGFLTGVAVADRLVTEDGGVTVVATVGLSQPMWAAAPDSGPTGPGTVNTLAFVPARLSEAALVNAVATVAEAKAQALWELGVPATGTPTDATAVLCPLDGPAEPYGGPRSRWGAPIARAAFRAICDGGKAWLNRIDSGR